ncbi:MAG: [citrate (pro-3S)-lyase] ligase, partial [Hafnia sp.]
AISASWVRKLLVQKDLPAIAPLVPEATRAYLQRLLVPRSENVTDRPQESALVTGEK